MIRKLFIVIVVVWRMFTQYLKLKWESIVVNYKKDPSEIVFLSTFTLLIVGLISGAIVLVEGEFVILGMLLMLTLWLVPIATVGIICLIKKIKKLIKSIKQEIKGVK